jgi:hypothetical protein
MKRFTVTFTYGFMGFALLGAAALVACGSSSGDDTSGSSGGASGGTSGGSSGGTSGLLGGSSGDGGSSGPGSGDLSGCATSSKKAEKVPVDMIIGLDTSFSMDFYEKWPNVRDALKVFVNDVPPTDLQVGLQFFPIRKQCSVADYAIPAVPLTPLAQAAAPITTALDAQQMAGGTPMVPLLQGLTQYLVGAAKPDRKQIIVLTTDGIPDLPADTCAGGTFPNTLDNAVVTAGNALKGTPSIPTFVIGVGSELTALNAVAQAGGTGQAQLIDVGGNVQESLLAALAVIRRQAIPCDFDIPTGTPLDVNSTNVTYTPGGSTKASSLDYVGSEDACNQAPSAQGWYFDNATNPTKVILCNALCQIVKQDDLGAVNLVFGCPRNGVK